jgi:hypothetical protein
LHPQYRCAYPGLFPLGLTEGNTAAIFFDGLQALFRSIKAIQKKGCQS